MSLRVLLSRPLLGLAKGFTDLAAGVAGEARSSAAEAARLRDVERAANVLYRGGFDTAAIADLLGECEADVLRWTSAPADDVEPAPRWRA